MTGTSRFALKVFVSVLFISISPIVAIVMLPVCAFVGFYQGFRICFRAVKDQWDGTADMEAALRLARRDYERDPEAFMKRFLRAGRAIRPSERKS